MFYLGQALGIRTVGMTGSLQLCRCNSEVNPVKFMKYSWIHLRVFFFALNECKVFKFIDLFLTLFYTILQRELNM